MTQLDWLIVAFASILAMFGYRQGFIVGVLSFAGFAVGAFLGTRLGPLLLPQGSASPYAPAFGLIGAARRGDPRERLRGPRLPAAPRAGGAGHGPARRGARRGAGAALGLGIVWILAAVAAQTPGQDQLRADIQRSAILRQLNQVLPPSGAILNASARLDPLPSIPGPTPDVAAPRPAIARAPGVKAASRSVVRVDGTACGLAIEGSGWVAEPDVVVTNAHVVAGEQDTTVEVAGRSPEPAPQAIAFDPRDDIAVLRVPELELPSLQLAAAAATARRDPRLSRNGPFYAQPGRIGRTQTVLTQDAYGRGPVSRLLTPLRGLVRPGNSGGPLVDSAGRVSRPCSPAPCGTSAGGYGVADETVAAVLHEADAHAAPRRGTWKRAAERTAVEARSAGRRGADRRAGVRRAACRRRQPAGRGVLRARVARGLSSAQGTRSEGLADGSGERRTSPWLRARARRRSAGSGRCRHGWRRGRAARVAASILRRVCRQPLLSGRAAPLAGRVPWVAVGVGGHVQRRRLRGIPSVAPAVLRRARDGRRRRGHGQRAGLVAVDQGPSCSSRWCADGVSVVPSSRRACSQAGVAVAAPAVVADAERSADANWIPIGSSASPATSRGPLSRQTRRWTTSRRPFAPIRKVAAVTRDPGVLVGQDTVSMGREERGVGRGSATRHGARSLEIPEAPSVQRVAARAFLPTKGLLEEVGDMVLLTGRTIRAAMFPPYPYGGELVSQFLFALRLCWLPLLLSTVSINYGAAGLQAANILALIGALDRLGGFFVLAAVREIGPLITSIVLAGVAGTAITADLGARKVREESTRCRCWA